MNKPFSSDFSNTSNSSSSRSFSSASSTRSFSSSSSSSRSIKAMVNRRSLLTAGDSFRKASNRAFSVGLQLEKLEALLCETSLNYCENSDLVKHVRIQFMGIAERKHFSNKELSRDELGDIVDTLKEILNTSPSLPANLVASVHSTIGLVRQLRGENKTAINSFMKALWIITATQEPNFEEIGITIHRLGIAHGRSGSNNEAMTLLEKALTVYRSGGFQENHPYILSVSTEIDVLRSKLMHESQKALSVDGFHRSSGKLETIVDRRLSEMST